MSRHALLIAVGEYEDLRLNALRAPQQDVTRLAAVLEDPAVGGFDSVRRVVDAPDHVIRRELEDVLASRSSDDLVLVYFSCHGISTPQRRLYFAASNTLQDRPAGTAVARTFVNELFEDCRAAGRVLLLDCCFSGAYGKGIKASVGGSVLDDDRVGEGYVVLTASNAFEYAFEEERLSLEAPQTSVFTDVLLEGLSSGAADLNGDGWIDVRELFDYVHREVTARRRDQTPKFFAHAADSAIRIARAAGSRVVAPRAVKPMYTPQQMLVARGFRAAAEPICRTLGPFGRRSVVLGEDGRYVELGDAASIAAAFRVSDPRDELGASYVRELVQDVHRRAGDGAATAVVVAQALIANLLEAMRAGAHPMRLKRSLAEACVLVCGDLGDRAQPVISFDQWTQLASSVGDAEIALVISDAVGLLKPPHGTVLVEESTRLGLGLELTSGTRFEGGYLSAQFITDTERRVVELDEPYVLVCGERLGAAGLLLPLFAKVARSGRPLVVIARDVAGEALSTLVANKVQDTLQSVAVRVGDEAELAEIATVAGTQVAGAESLKRIDINALGRIRKAVVREHETVLVVDLPKRVARPGTFVAQPGPRVALVTVGALSTSGMAERRKQIERAVLALRSAQARGVVEGGGAALASATSVLDPADPAHVAAADALRHVQRRIAENAGLDPDAPNEPDARVVDSVEVLCVAVDGAVRTADRFLLLG
ncbi:caspase family protein [Lentzea alba]|uniref:caspase, EACC1-associated type n=1 Tax=Lentzea alba TaxID=2714351 RepID=UPI0039BEF014